MGAPTKLRAEVRKFDIVRNRIVQLPALKLDGRKTHSTTQITHCSSPPVAARMERKFSIPTTLDCWKSLS